MSKIIKLDYVLKFAYAHTNPSTCSPREGGRQGSPAAMNDPPSCARPLPTTEVVRMVLREREGGCDANLVLLIEAEE